MAVSRAPTLYTIATSMNRASEMQRVVGSKPPVDTPSECNVPPVDTPSECNVPPVDTLGMQMYLQTKFPAMPFLLYTYAVVVRTNGTSLSSRVSLMQS